MEGSDSEVTGGDANDVGPGRCPGGQLGLREPPRHRLRPTHRFPTLHHRLSSPFFWKLAIVIKTTVTSSRGKDLGVHIPI